MTSAEVMLAEAECCRRACHSIERAVEELEREGGKNDRRKVRNLVRAQIARAMAELDMADVMADRLLELHLAEQTVAAPPSPLPPLPHPDRKRT